MVQKKSQEEKYTCFGMKSFKKIRSKWPSKCQALKHNICITAAVNMNKH